MTSHPRRRPAAPARLSRALGRSVLLLACGAIAAGCGGGQRPARPDRTEAGDAALLLSAADSAAALGSTAEAHAAYERAVRMAKAAGDRRLEARAALGLGLVSLTQGEAEPARRSLLRALELDPSSAAAHVALGRYLVAIRRYRDAKGEFERAAALDTLSAEPWSRLGLAYAEAGDVRLAIESFTRALARDPTYAQARSGLRSVLEARCVAVGLPAEYAALRERPSVSRGELGVMLAAELGVDPDRPGWREGTWVPSEIAEAKGAWGERWLRAAMARGWIAPFPDGSYRLGDPVTRGALALFLTGIERSWPAWASDGTAPESTGLAAAPDVFSDLGSRHYIFRAARNAVRFGLPLRPGGRFEPWASATGAETLLAIDGLARILGAQPILSEEPAASPMVK